MPTFCAGALFPSLPSRETKQKLIEYSPLPLRVPVPCPFPSMVQSSPGRQLNVSAEVNLDLVGSHVKKRRD